MNLLFGKLPEMLEIDSKLYPINTDYRAWIIVENMLLSRNLTEKEKRDNINKLCYKAAMPSNREMALTAALHFFRCGNKTQKPSKSQVRLYDFEFDAEQIYCAFQKQYGINLQKADLHWWEFRA